MAVGGLETGHRACARSSLGDLFDTLYTAFGLLDRHPRTVGSDGGAVVLNAFVVDVSNHFGLSNEVGGAVELRTLYSWTGARFFLQGS